MTKGIATSLVLVTVALGATGVALGQGDAGTSPRPDQTDQPRATGPSSEISKNFGIFRRQRTAGDDVSKDDATARSAGADPTQARRAVTAPSGDAVFLSPGRGSLCIGTARIGNVSCAPTKTAVAGQLINSVICGGIPADALNLYGAVPDGVTEVAVLRRDGSVRRLPIKDNAYVIEAKKTDPLPKTISWETPEGTVEIAAPVPADAAETRCVAPDSKP